MNAKCIGMVLVATLCTIGSCYGGTNEWPSTLIEGRARIVRLKYQGGDWDLNMGEGRDYNLLLWYHVVTGFDIAEQSEAVSASELPGMSDAQLPSFLLITGGLKGGIEVTDDEIAVIRQFCLQKGGTLFAINGGGNFDREVRIVLKRTFPEAELVDIPNGALLYRQPFSMPNGAPAMWHHSGNRALGMKVRERWVVFYHQGDLADGWRDSHSGARESLAIESYKMGFNIMHYAYTQREQSQKHVESEKEPNKAIERD